MQKFLPHQPDHTVTNNLISTSPNFIGFNAQAVNGEAAKVSINVITSHPTLSNYPT